MNDAVRSRPARVVVEDRRVARARSGRRACSVAGPVTLSPVGSATGLGGVTDMAVTFLYEARGRCNLAYTLLTQPGG